MPLLARAALLLTLLSALAPLLDSPSPAVAWIGQDGSDRAGPGPAVGPDGLQDVHLVLSGLRADAGIAAIAVAAGGEDRWEFGLNPRGLWDAAWERRADDPARGDLFLQPDLDRAGETFTLTVRYADGATGSASCVASHADAALPVAPPPAPLDLLPISARWAGQGSDGWLRIALGGLPPGRAIARVAVSDPAGGYWAEPAPSGAALPMRLQRAPGGAALDLALPPFRDEVGSRLTALVAFQDGSAAVAQLDGGACDPYRRAPEPDSAAVVARPGDDLYALAARYGRIRLSAGTYRLDRPWVLDRPVDVEGGPDATLLFAQPPSAPTWMAALKVRRGGTTLRGFRIRFAGPVRWTREFRFGPAVVGSPDQFDPPDDDPIAGVTLDRLDLESPPMPPGAPLEEAPRAIRMSAATSGRIVRCRIKGGVTEVVDGPWEIADNEYLGAMPGTFAYDTFAAHHSHDLRLTGNRVHPTRPCGKTWRFLVMTNGGANDRVERNRVWGVGPRDDDSIPNPNAAETLLTEAYSLHFEGAPSAVAAGGRVLVLPYLQGDPPRAGDVVSVLTGPHAGEWRRIAAPLGARSWLMDDPLPEGPYAVSVATGFVGEAYERNVLDCRGSSTAGLMVLVGNHYGTRIVGNRLMGGGDAFKITAAPTEHPVLWGWSHAPFLGGLFQANRIIDSRRGGSVSVEHSRFIKTSSGRVYMTLRIDANRFQWTPRFLARLRAAGVGPPRALTVGDPGSLDPDELKLDEGGNSVRSSPGTPGDLGMRIHSGWVNGRTIRDADLLWPNTDPPPSGVRTASGRRRPHARRRV